MDCELCGKKATGRARIEGAIIDVCDSCASMGQIIYEPKPVEMRKRPQPAAPEEIVFDRDFSSIISSARQKRSLSREQLAEQIKEKVAVIERIEKGLRPEKKVAQKLERFLGVRIMGSPESEKTVFKENHASDVTLGDIATVRKRKK